MLPWEGRQRLQKSTRPTGLALCCLLEQRKEINMPSSFASFSNGDVVEASHVAEMHAPIQNLERGAAFYAGTTGGSSTAYSAQG